MGRNHFLQKDHCDLDLCPSGPKINAGHVLANSNQHVKNFSR